MNAGAGKDQRDFRIWLKQQAYACLLFHFSLRRPGLACCHRHRVCVTRLIFIAQF